MAELVVHRKEKLWEGSLKLEKFRGGGHELRRATGSCCTESLRQHHSQLIEPDGSLFPNGTTALLYLVDKKLDGTCSVCLWSLSLDVTGRSSCGASLWTSLGAPPAFSSPDSGFS